VNLNKNIKFLTGDFHAYYIESDKFTRVMHVKRIGSNTPLKPLGKYKPAVVYALYFRGQRSDISLFDILKNAFSARHPN